jgi:sialic acid synthase SpsE
MAQSQHVYIIAEAGINHGGDMAVAREMVVRAAAAGADAVKFQSFTADGLTHAQLAADQHAFFARYELGRAEHAELAALCAEHGVDFLSTPFDFALADMLAGLGVPAFKIASCDLTNLPLIVHCARYGRPLFISTGMGSQAEAAAAAASARAAGAPHVVLLQCTTSYPTPYPAVQLSALAELAQLGPVGFSDHSVGNYCCFAAVALGATVIEKHFCLDKSAPGPDIACSCDPVELADLVQGIRALEQALGGGGKRQLAEEADVARIARRGAYFARDLEAGALLGPDGITYLRPAGRLTPGEAAKYIGRGLGCPVRAGEELLPEHFADVSVGAG